jgi:hypothetical protein
MCVLDGRQVIRRNEPNPKLVNGNRAMLRKNLMDRVLPGSLTKSVE